MARPCLLTFLLVAAAAVLAWAPGGALGKSKLAKKSDDIVNGPLLTEKIKAKKTLIVGPDEEFKTVQSAIDAVPAGNAEWIIVHLRSGLHRHSYAGLHFYFDDDDDDFQRSATHVDAGAKL